MKLLMPAVMLALTLFLAACGSPSPAVSLYFEGNDRFQFSPANATAPAGAEVTVTFQNVGVLEHDWMLIPESVNPITATEADAIAGAHSGILSGGESATFTFTAPPPGEYTIVCTLPGHAAAGMVGTLTVTE